MTFHWASNYGAILQAYALQQFLKRHGVETEIVDYVPFRVVFIRMLQRIRTRDASDFVREFRMRRFRRRYLDVSPRRYRRSSDLRGAAGAYDALVCGSDQIWNEWFTLNAEGGPTCAYFLDYAAEGVKKISYAASFGTDSLTEPMARVVGTELATFDAIGVREESGASIVAALDLKATVVADPTLLLSSEDYDDLIGAHRTLDLHPLFTYILHNGQVAAHSVADHLASTYFNGQRLYDREPISPLDWLSQLRHANYVLTNSFHGLVFSLVFERPFMVVAVEGAGESMNGRFRTLLKSVCLEERLLTSLDVQRVDTLYSQPIDWPKVRYALDSMRDASAEFLLGALGTPGAVGVDSTRRS